MRTPKIYLDHAATGWPKDEAVYAAIEKQMRDGGVAAGRGTYARGMASSNIVSHCRQLANQLFSSPVDGRWLLLSSGTHALNQAIQGILEDGDHVVTSAAEHSSVLRPLHAFRLQGKSEYSITPVDRSGRFDAEEVLARIRPTTKLVVLTHGSNVTGALQPIDEVGAALQQIPETQRPLLLIDAAQTAGLVPIDLSEQPIDLLAMPGHKFLGGPLGTALLFVGPRAWDRLRPIMPGGTGLHSDQLTPTEKSEHDFEAGNANVPALAGLRVALQRALEQDWQANMRHCESLVQMVYSALSELPQVTLFSANELPIVSLIIKSWDTHELSTVLDSQFGIETRAGLHCAPRIHPALQAPPGGTLRTSFGHETTAKDVRSFIEAIHEICTDGT